MEDDVPNEERVVASEKLYKLLGKFEKEDFKLSEFHHEAEIQETMHIPTHLFSMLKSCQQHAKFDVSLKILLFLVENQQCGKQFLWKMFANFLQKDCVFFLPLFSDLTKALSKSLKVHHDEWRLFYTVLLLNKEMYDKAHKEACNFDVKESILETYFVETAKAASSALLVGYKTILDYRTIDTNDDDMLNVLKESFLLLFSKKTCEPLFAQPFTYILMKLNLQEEAETFLKRYVEKESKGNVGISAALHALNIIKLLIPKASPKLIISFLEMIAQRDSGNPKVLDLCHHYLNMPSSGMCSDFESEFDSEIGAISSVPKPNGLNKCLQLMMYFIDVYVKHLPSAIIREGWSVMAEIMKRICVQEAKDCFQSIIDLWHNDRKRWWPCFRLPRTGLPSTLSTGDAEFYSNKGFVCYVLESQDHPFVVSLMEHQECRLLKSLVEQLCHPKVKFDSHIEAMQRANEPVIAVSLVSQPIMPRMAVSSPQTRMTPSLSMYNAIDSEAIAEEFPIYLLTTCPLKSKQEYCNKPQMRKSTKKLLKLDIHSLISKRYAKRRKICVQKKYLRLTRAQRAATLSTCSVKSFESLDSSMEESEDGDDIMTDGTLSQDEDGSPSKLLQNPCQLNENVLVKKRWEIFIKNGRWGSFSVNDDENSSGEEYAPSLSNDEDSCSDESDDESCEANTRANTRAVIASSYPASIPSSYSSISPASSIFSGYTPDLQFSNFPSQPRDFIPNEDRSRFMEFDSFSVCSTSTTDEIAKNITQVIRKLNVDNDMPNAEPTGIDPGAEEFVVEEDVVIPQEDLIQTSSRNNVFPSENENEEIDLPEEAAATFNHQRSFSRDFEPSSPDMFESMSEDEDRYAVNCFDENKESSQNKGDDNSHTKAMNSTTVHQKTPSSSVSTPFVAPKPLAVSTPVIVHKSKDKNKIVKSKTKRLTNASQNGKNGQSASDSRVSKKKKKSETSKSCAWSISLIDHVLKESLEESVITPKNSSSASNLRKRSSLENETFKNGESCTQPGNYNRGIVEETLHPIASTSTIMKSSLPNKPDVFLNQPPSFLTTSQVKDLDSPMIHQKMQAKKSLPSSVSKSNPATTPLAVSSAKTVHKKKEEKKVDAKLKKPRTKNATDKETKKQSDSKIESKKRKDKQGDEWQNTLIDDLLTKKSCKDSETKKQSAADIPLSKGKKRKTKEGDDWQMSLIDDILSKKSCKDSEKKKKSASDSRSSGSKKKKIKQIDEWQESLVDLLLKQSCEESLLTQEKSSLTSIGQSSTIETLPRNTINSTNKKREKTKTKKSASMEVNVLAESDVADRLPKSSRGKSLSTRKCHIREKNPDYLSASESD